MEKELNVEERLRFSFDELQYAINKYRENDEHQVVYTLTYAGKVLVVKGKTLAGSLINISEGLYRYRENTDNGRFKEHLYKKFYDHFINNVGRLRIKILAKYDEQTSHFDLLKKEQTEIEKNNSDKILNSYDEAYIPKYNKATGLYGWLNSEDVNKFQGWMITRRRNNEMKRYKFKPKK